MAPECTVVNSGITSVGDVRTSATAGVQTNSVYVTAQLPQPVVEAQTFPVPITVNKTVSKTYAAQDIPKNEKESVSTVQIPVKEYTKIHYDYELPENNVETVDEVKDIIVSDFISETYEFDFPEDTIKEEKVSIPVYEEVVTTKTYKVNLPQDSETRVENTFTVPATKYTTTTYDYCGQIPECKTDYKEYTQKLDVTKTEETKYKYEVPLKDKALCPEDLTVEGKIKTAKVVNYDLPADSVKEETSEETINQTVVYATDFKPLPCNSGNCPAKGAVPSVYDFGSNPILNPQLDAETQAVDLQADYMDMIIGASSEAVDSDILIDSQSEEAVEIELL
uniref:Peptidoglycan-associated protein n=1 Tax=Cyanophora paradoxa TaxID=2762 RepID=A0A0H5B1P1_CYAPA|nr:peptidoglycan-associated protein [Cyanophora paradoxa]